MEDRHPQQHLNCFTKFLPPNSKNVKSSLNIIVQRAMHENKNKSSDSYKPIHLVQNNMFITLTTPNSADCKTTTTTTKTQTRLKQCYSPATFYMSSVKLVFFNTILQCYSATQQKVWKAPCLRTRAPRFQGHL